MSCKTQKAFTLAEVLITLGIIGVVATMTMPSLIQNTKKSEATARLKKFNSMMQQAIIMSENDNGIISSDWTQNSVTEEVTQGMTTKKFFMTYLAPYIKYNRIEDNAGGVIIYFADGTKSQMYKGGCMDFIFDINGNRKPNVEGRDKFRFLSCPARSDWCEGRRWCAYYTTADSSREKRLENCKKSGTYCSGLLEYDNWEFKDDYPRRL